MEELFHIIADLFILAIAFTLFCMFIVMIGVVMWQAWKSLVPHFYEYKAMPKEEPNYLQYKEQTYR